MAKRTSPPPELSDPDRLSRQRAGAYRSADDRFEVREADAGWFVVDMTRTNDFGQELIHGPFPTLKAAGGSLPERRAADDAPKRPRARAGGGKSKGTRTSKDRPSPAPEPPPSWIDALPKADAADVRRVIAALESEGMRDADAVVRRDRDGLLPAIATRRVEDRLDALIADLPESHREAARAIAQRVAEVLTAEGTSARRSLPGWALVEVDSGVDLPGRRIDLRR